MKISPPHFYSYTKLTLKIKNSTYVTILQDNLGFFEAYYEKVSPWFVCNCLPLILFGREHICEERIVIKKK